MKRLFKSLLFLIMLLVSTFAVAQQDTLLVKNFKKKNPKKAAIFSAIIPSAGQIYNGKYWKAPVVWAGMGALVYLALQNSTEFNRTNDSLELYKETDKNGNKIFKTDAFSSNRIASLGSEADFYRRNRDLCYIGLFAFYMYQIIDASVDAHLSEFDLNDKLALNITPHFNLRGSASLALNFKIKAPSKAFNKLY